MGDEGIGFRDPVILPAGIRPAAYAVIMDSMFQAASRDGARLIAGAASAAGAEAAELHCAQSAVHPAEREDPR